MEKSSIWRVATVSDQRLANSRGFIFATSVERGVALSEEFLLALLLQNGGSLHAIFFGIARVRDHECKGCTGFLLSSRVIERKGEIDLLREGACRRIVKVSQLLIKRDRFCWSFSSGQEIGAQLDGFTIVRPLF